MTRTAGLVDNSSADTYAWFDRACKPRSAALLRNDGPDAFGGRGGVLRTLTYEANNQKRTARGTGANGWQGFGYIINHHGGGASTTRAVTGKTTVILAGKHHSVHEFKWRVSPGGPVDVTAHWITATGKDHPLFSITFDATPAGSNGVNADSRAPYGDIVFEGGGQAGPIDGIGWGDKHKFRTQSAPVTASSTWDYSAPNTIPDDFMWSNNANAEMGLVATHAFDTGPSGGDYGGGVQQR